MWPNSKTKEKQRKGSLNIGIITLLLNILLLIDILLLSCNIFLVKQNTILHILERVKMTQVFLREKPDLLDNFFKALFMLPPVVMRFLIAAIVTMRQK